MFTRTIFIIIGLHIAGAAIASEKENNDKPQQVANDTARIPRSSFKKCVKLCVGLFDAKHCQKICSTTYNNCLQAYIQRVYAQQQFGSRISEK